MSAWAASSNRRGCSDVWRNSRLAVADDGDDLAFGVAAAAGRAGRDSAGDVVALDLSVGTGRGELVRFAIGVGGSRPAFVAGGEAAVDAVAVRFVGDDEHAVLGLRGAKLRHGKQSG